MTDSKKKNKSKPEVIFKPKKSHGGFGQQGGGFNRGGKGFAPQNIAKASGRKR